MSFSFRISVTDGLKRGERRTAPAFRHFASDLAKWEGLSRRGMERRFHGPLSGVIIFELKMSRVNCERFRDKLSPSDVMAELESGLVRSTTYLLPGLRAGPIRPQRAPIED